MELSQLKKRGWVTEDPNRFLLLTDDGKRITELVSNNFEVLRCFFEQILGLEKESALADACKIEHLINIETGERLQKLVAVILDSPKFYEKIKQQMAVVNNKK